MLFKMRIMLLALKIRLEMLFLSREVKRANERFDELFGRLL